MQGRTPRDNVPLNKVDVAGSYQKARYQTTECGLNGLPAIAPGVYRSADGLRQFRMTTSDLAGAHGPIGAHIHFEALNAQGVVTENLHVPLLQ